MAAGRTTARAVALSRCLALDPRPASSNSQSRSVGLPVGVALPVFDFRPLGPTAFFAVTDSSTATRAGAGERWSGCPAGLPCWCAQGNVPPPTPAQRPLLSWRVFRRRRSSRADRAEHDSIRARAYHSAPHRGEEALEVITGRARFVAGPDALGLAQPFDQASDRVSVVEDLSTSAVSRSGESTATAIESFDTSIPKWTNPRWAILDTAGSFLPYVGSVHRTSE